MQGAFPNNRKTQKPDLPKVKTTTSCFQLTGMIYHQMVRYVYMQIQTASTRLKTATGLIKQSVGYADQSANLQLEISPN